MVDAKQEDYYASDHVLPNALGAYRQSTSISKPFQPFLLHLDCSIHYLWHATPHAIVPNIALYSHRGRNMDLNNPTLYMPQLAQRFQTLIWTCIDNELYRSAHFYAERYLSLDPDNHDARHLYATSLLHEKQFHSALFHVSRPTDAQCGGCAEIRSKCETALGRHRQAYQSLETCLTDITNMCTLTNSLC